MRWEKKTIGQLVDLYGGKIQSGPFGSQLHQHDYKPEGVPVVMPKDIVNDQISTSSIARISEDDADRLGKHRLKIGDLILPRRGDIDKRAICKFNNEGWLCGTGCLKIRLNDEVVDPNFLYFYFNLPFVVESILNKAVGSTMLNLSGSILSSTEIVYPPLPTQRRIASILSAYDELIENNLRRVKLLEERAFLRYKEIVRREKMETISVFNYAEIMSGGTPSTTNPNFWEGEIPFFTPKDLASHSGYYLNDTERKITELGLEKCNSRLFPRDTIFITARGTVGKIVLAKIPSAISQSNYAITTRNGASNFFLFLALIDKIDHFKQLAVGGVFDTIIVDTFKMIFLDIPDNEVINDFNDFIKPVFSQIDILQQQNTKLREARDILLPRLMNGEIVV